MLNRNRIAAATVVLLLVLGPINSANAQSQKPASPKSTIPLAKISQLDKSRVGKQVSFVGTVFDATCSSSGLTYQLVDDSGGIFVNYSSKVYDAIPQVENYAVGATVRITGTVVQGKTKLVVSVAHADATAILTTTQRVVPAYHLGGLTAADYNVHMQIEADIYQVEVVPQGLDLIVFDKTGAQRVRLPTAVLNRFPQRDKLVAGSHIHFVGQAKINHQTGLYLTIALPTDILELVSSDITH